MTRIQSRIPVVNTNWMVNKVTPALMCSHTFYIPSWKYLTAHGWPNPLEGGFGENLLGVIMVGNDILLEGGKQNLAWAEKYHTLDNRKLL